MRYACLRLIIINLQTTTFTFRSIFLIVTVTSFLIGSVIGQMDDYVDSFSTSCTDSTYCYKVATLCHSLNRRFRDTVRRRCPCTCEASLRASICCQNMEVSSQCQPLCGYDHNAAQNFFADGLSCATELPKIMLCVAQNQDVRPCCMHSAVNYDSPCMTMCHQGRTQPACTFKDMIGLEQCLIEDMPRVLRCFQKNLTHVEPLLRTDRYGQHVCPNQIEDLKKFLDADQINSIDFFRRVRARR